MRAFAFAAGLFAVAAIANPVNLVKRGAEEPCDEDAAPCMTLAQAQTVADNFKNLIANYSNQSANAELTRDFTDYSDSVNTLIDGGCSGPQPLGSATFSSRKAFEIGQGGQPPIPFEILNLWHTCDTVVIRWKSAQTPEQVTGIIVLETKYSKRKHAAEEPYLIQTVYSEFNSGAWLVNLGVFTPTCNATAS